MPQVKCVSLKEICMNFISENQDFFCKRFAPGELEDCVDALDSDKPAVNSFDELPIELLEELIRILREKESNHALYGKRYKITALFKLLMTSRLRTLNLTKIDVYSVISANVLHLATIRSPQLETLRIDYTTRNHVETFNFISKFMKLRILDISLCKADDDCLNLIGKHCPELREFYVKFGQVTDDGIRKLCVDGNCKFIYLLDLEKCRKITTKGIQLALDNLPQLRVLRHESLLECLAEIAQIALHQKLLLPKYSLTALYILNTTTDYKSGSLQQSVLMCPNVTEVYLTVGTRGLKDTDLLSLLSLEILYTIEITHGVILEQLPGGRVRIDNDLSFDGVVLLLKKFGFCLKRLMIGSFFVVDIPVIIELCPNLEFLTLDNCKTTQITETEVKTPRFQNLKQLILKHFLTISSENLYLLLSSPSLAYISMAILYCDVLTDDVLYRAAKFHSFRNLEYLHLSNCNLVTKNGIDIFLKESNPLKKIVLGHHPSARITREDIINWNNTAIWIKKNWQFDFVLWYAHRSIYLGDRILEGVI